MLLKKNSKKLKLALSFIKQPYNLLFLLAWGASLLEFWRGINNHIPVLKEFTDELEWLIVIIPILLSLKKLLKPVKSIDFFFFLGCLLLYLTNFLLYPENQEPLESHFFNFAVLALPYYFIGLGVDVKKFIKPFFYVSLLSLSICVFYEFFYVQNSGARLDLDTSDYNMNLSYNMLHHVLLITWVTLKEFKLWQAPFMLLGVFLLLSLGTRGPILCLIIFFAIYLLFFKPSKFQKTMRLLTIAISLYAITFIQEFMLMMQGMMIQFGMSTRIFDKYLEGEMETSFARDYIKTTLYSTLKNDTGFTGFGILGSYRFVDTYSHNLFLDLWFSFGWFVGSILICVLFYLIIKALLINNYEINRVFLLLLVCSSVIKLLLSSTFIDDAMFFMLIGYCVNTMRCFKLNVTYQ